MNADAGLAARRIRATLAVAKRDGHYTNGWYAYIDRQDVETVVEATIGPETPPLYIVQVTDETGVVKWEGHVPAEDIDLSGAPLQVSFTLVRDELLAAAEELGIDLRPSALDAHGDVHHDPPGAAMLRAARGEEPRCIP